MRREFSFPNKTSAREEGAELFSLLSSPDSVASVFVCQIDEVETKFLSANSISEFSHSLGQSLHIHSVRTTSAYHPTPNISPRRPK